MLSLNKFDKIAVFDIETASKVKSWDLLSEREKLVWIKYSDSKLSSNDPLFVKVYKSLQDRDFYSESFEEISPLIPEFNKIVCMSVTMISNEAGVFRFNTKSIENDGDNYAFLIKVRDFFVNCSVNNFAICGHNINGFDIPVISKHLIINKIKLPSIIDLFGKKPWELDCIIDTSQLWKLGGMNYTSLDMLTMSLDIDSPKDDIQGNQVSKVYWNDNDLKRISKYCEKDTIACAKALIKMSEEYISNPNSTILG